MADDKKLKVEIETKADTSGAENAEKSIFAIEDAAKRAERELDIIEARRRKAAADNKGGLLGVDLTGKVDELGKKIAEFAGFGDQFDTVSKLVGADGAAIVGSIAAVGVAAVKSYKALSDTVTGYERLFKEAKARGQEVRPELEAEVAALKASLGGLPGLLTSVQEGFAELWKDVTNPVDALTGLGDLEESLKNQAISQKKLDDARLKAANINQSDLKNIYLGELEALREQEATFQRIAGLRAQKFELAQEGANQEVESARLRGGDVALAQANALSLEIEAGISRLNDQLGGVKAEAATAEQEFNTANFAYQQAVRDELDKLAPKEFAAISAAVDEKQKAFRESNQAVADQSALYTEAKNNLLRGAENELAKLDTDTKEAVTKASQQARDGIYQTLRDEVAKGPQEAITAIKPSVQPITDAATAKAAEVSEKLSQTAAEVSGTGDKMATAVGEFGKSIAARDERFLTLMASLLPVSENLLNRLTQYEQRLASLEQRSAQ